MWIQNFSYQNMLKAYKQTRFAMCTNSETYDVNSNCCTKAFHCHNLECYIYLGGSSPNICIRPPVPSGHCLLPPNDKRIVRSNQTEQRLPESHDKKGNRRCLCVEDPRGGRRQMVRAVSPVYFVAVDMYTQPAPGAMWRYWFTLACLVALFVNSIPSPVPRSGRRMMELVVREWDSQGSCGAPSGAPKERNASTEMTFQSILSSARFPPIHLNFQL